MSSIAYPALRERAFGIALTADRVAVSSLVALSALLALLTWGTWGVVGGDTGYDLLAGSRVAGGELPYVDFVYYYGPLAPFALALAGGGLGGAIVLGLALAVGIVVATYALARLLVAPLGAFLAAALVAPVAFGPGNFGFVLPHSFSASLGMLGLLVAVVALARRRPLVAGVAAGLVALTRPELAAAAALALGAMLVLQRTADPSVSKHMASRSAAALRVAVPALAIPAAVYGAFAIAAGPSALVFENLYPVDELAAGGNAVLSIHAPLTLASAAELGVRLMAYAAGAAVLVAVARLLGRRSHQVAVAALAVAALAFLIRPETVRYGLEFAYGWIPAGAALAAAYLLLRRRDPLLVALTLALTLLAAKTYAAFFVHAPVPQMAVYALPLAAVLLVRLHLVELGRRSAVLGAAWLAFLALAGAGLTIKDARAEPITVPGPGGSLQASPAEAAAYGEALQWILAGSAPGDPVLLAPQLTSLYALSERTNALPQLSLLPGALADAAEERVAAERLGRAGVRIAIVDRRPFTEYGHTSFGDSFHSVLAGWLERNFVKAASIGSAEPGSPSLEVWVRRTR